MNLLGLLLKGFLEDRLAQPRVAGRARRISGAFGIEAGTMRVTLRFDRGGVQILSGFAPRLRAHLHGSLDHLLHLVAAGSWWRAVGAILRRHLGVGGNPLALLELLPVMLAQPAGPAMSSAGGCTPGASRAATSAGAARDSGSRGAVPDAARGAEGTPRTGG
jgi:hypothetical protein